MTGKKLIDTILVGLSLIATITTLGIFLYTNMLAQRPLPSNVVEKKALDEDIKKNELVATFKMEPIVVNLIGQRQKLRFLSLELFLHPLKEEDTEVFKENIPQLNDTIIDIASKIPPNELNTLTGKMILENRLVHAMNKVLKKDSVKEIYFSKFVIQ